MPKANAIIKITRACQISGLKVYGKARIYEPVEPGDKGFCEPLGKMSMKDNPGKTHAFYPAKWGYTWLFMVGPEEFEFINKNVPSHANP